MLNSEIKSKIDRLWDSFWSGGISNPLTVVEQISYLLFIKKLDDIEIAKEKKAKIITITSNVFSEISFLSDIVFKISVENNGFFNSYIVPMELCNIILTALFEKNKTSIYAELKENSLVKDFLFTSEN